MASPTEDLRARLAVLADLRAARVAAGLGPRDDDAAARRGRRAARSRRRSTRSSHERLAGPELADAARRGRGVRARGRGRGDRPRRATRPRPRDADPRRADVRDGARDRRGAAGVGGRARGVGLRGVPAAPGAPGRAAPRGRRVLPRGRPSLRRAAGGPRAGHDHGGRRRGLRRAARRARPADRRDRRASRPAAAARPVRAAPGSARSRSTMARAIGYDDEGWRLDDSAHPFSTVVGPGDQRVTARWDETDLGGIFAVLHEVGHGLYEQQIGPSLRRTTLDSRRLATASTSRRAACGRTRSAARSAFWSHWLPRAQDGAAGARRPRPRRLPAPRQRRAPDAHPRRGRRGDLRAPRDPALRARARADGGHARRRRHPGGVERRDARPARASRSPTTRTAACRTSTGRSASSATSRRTRSATS